ncbi:SusD/RagB family nutrient-binding outer membrane lipoprotein [Spirosoma sp. BT702]|uniref:SusD/RagB family nutrient-binding outer membrane lipoprotein n=1 Tax=Spirosoma profusum TaxID=2771354 RepID=A0A926Y008_9BACT|nr:SusD/RagB family nutrient-binding outer membrane lipoprotein [Spirosoma profusum]MBD2700998.1 SusD/RagB family nutrient-binding outer membrane lipoprotein [Spirosoma profusum]
MTNIFRKSALLLPFLLGMGACSKFLDVNVTPNNPTAVPNTVLLPGAEFGTAFANANELNRFASTLTQQLAGAANSPQNYDVYVHSGADFGNQWRFELYDGALVNYQQVIKQADASGSKAYSGVAKIMKAYTYALTTDVWGDIPYSQALQGEAILQPRLDKQEDIYKGNQTAGIQSLFDLVREGIADLSATSATKPGNDDAIYKGDLAKWRRAGNTLLLKLANTISRKEPALAKSVIDQVITAGDYIKTNADDLNVTFGASVGSRDPRYEYTNISSFKDDLIMSTRYLTLLQGLNDPRLPIFFTKPATNYVTWDNGQTGARPSPVTTWSRYNSYVTGANGEGPVRLLTNFQRAFILAESALILGTAGDPQALYTEGIRASMTLAGLTAAQIDTYLAANPKVATLTGTNAQKLEQIITQKYIAFTGNGIELWNDYRRTGYPVLQNSQNAVGFDGTRPVRGLYVSQELERNPNFPNPAPQTNVKLWWDVD